MSASREPSKDALFASLAENDAASRSVSPTSHSLPQSAHHSRWLAEPLSTGEQERLAEILDEYLRAAESGAAPDPEQFAARYPEYQDVLRDYLSGLALLQEGFPEFRDLLSAVPRDEWGDSSAPRRLGDYQLLREVGRGGMGIVYEAQQVSLQRRVALKILPFAAMLDHRQVMRFQNEARAAAQLQHPHIVPIHSVGTDRGVHYYAMQFIEGVSLSRVIEERREAAENPSSRSSLAHYQSAAEWARQAAEGLHAAHECGVVHRDIKPSNLLIDGHQKLWIADFGLARCTSDANVTHSGDLVGTLNYMSPEQSLGSASWVDHRTDIYSLGATLYELVTGRAAFEGRDATEVARRIQLGDFKRPRHWNPHVPIDLENVILKAMATHVQDRYTHAHDLAEDLRRFLTGLPTLARRPSWRKRSLHWARRHRRAVMVGGVLAFLGTVGILVSIGLLREQAAKTNHALARYEDAKSAVHEVGSRAVAQLDNMPGTEHVRRELLRDMLTYSRRFLEEASEQSHTTVDVAMTYTEMAAINQQLGDLSGALADYREAERLLNAASIDDPRRADRAALRARCQNNIGLLLRSLGRLDEAKQTLRSSIQTQQQAVVRSDANVSPEQRTELALTWNNLGLVLADQGKRTDAEASYRRAIQLLETSDAQAERSRGSITSTRSEAEAEEDAADAMAVLATVYNNWSLLTDSNLEEAIALSKKALLCQRSLLDASPDLTKEETRQVASHLANTCNSLASLFSRNHGWNEAIVHYQEAADWQRQLVEAAPRLPQPRSHLAVTLNNMGLAQFSAEQWEAAEKNFQEAIELQKTLVKEFPADLMHASRLGGLENNLALIYQQRKDWPAAARALEQGVLYQRYAVEGAPQNAEFREHLSRNYYNLTRVLLQLNRLREARETALSRRALWPNDPEQLYAVAKELTPIALRFHAAPDGQSRYTECVDAIVETLELAQAAGWTLKAEQADDPVWQHFTSDPRFVEIVNRTPRGSDLHSDR